MTFKEIDPSFKDEWLRMTADFWPDSTSQEMNSLFNELLEKEDRTAYFLTDDDTVIGFVYLSTRYDYVEGAAESPVGYLEGIYVKGAFRKQVNALKMMDKAREWAKEMGYKQLGSDAEIQNSASINFHRKAGFKKVNRIVCYMMEV